jgi:hypothetical protein
MKFVRTFLVFALLFGATLFVAAQTPVNITVSAVEVFAVNSAADPVFTVDDTGVAAGELPAITQTAGTATYLQYTVVTAVADSFYITAVSDTNVPVGLRLNVWAGAPTGTGDTGSAVAGGLEVTSSVGTVTGTTIIDGISSCATGSGTTQGPAIYYDLTFEESNFNLLVPVVAADYTITFTLTDA